MLKKIYKEKLYRDVLCYVMLLCTFNYSVVFAIPSGATVVDGSLAVPVDYGTTTTVTVDTVKTILNWTSIDTDVDETLAFLKSGGGNFAVLNKVTSGVPTNFYGTLSAPGGNIIIVNTSGLIFGGIATVRNLTLSGKNIANSDFINGDIVNPDNINYVFSGPGADVEVLSGAEIGAKLVALIGENVYNHGAITTDSGGYIVMGAGDTVQFGFVGSDIVVEVDGAGDSAVENQGELESPDGTIWLAAGDVYSLAMSLEGTDAASINIDGENSVVIDDFGKKKELDLGKTDLNINTDEEGYVKFDSDATIKTTTGDITMIAGSGEENGGVGIDIGNLVVGSETGKDPVAPEAGSIELGTRNGGDIVAGYLNVFGGSSAEILVQAGGDLTITGGSSTGAIMAKTNQVRQNDSGEAIICLQAGGDLTINYGIEVVAHGTDSAVADIHLHADGNIDVDTENGRIKSLAKATSQDGVADAKVRIHYGENVTINGGENAVWAEAHSGGNLAQVKNSGENAEETNGNAYGLIEIAEDFVGCEGCLDLGDNDTDTDLDIDTDTDLDLDMDTDNDTDTDLDTDTDDDFLKFEPMIEEVGSGGCPALVQWAANELGVNPDEIQIFVANSLGSRSDIQPCDTCSKLKGAATILSDSGQRLETLAMVVNQFASPAGPPSDEQMAMIAGILNSGEGPQYAAAQEWIDALVVYVGILNSDFGYDAEQSVAYANKYLAPVLEGDNAALTAYVTGLLQNAVQ